MSIEGTDRSNKCGLDTAKWKNIDITDEESIRGTISEVKPDAVINAAAIANIDQAEELKDMAWKVNVDGARFASKICNEYGVKYLFLSSDAVFDGEGTSYREEDNINPVNYYGYTKSEAEKAVISANPQAVVVRISLVLGFSITGGETLLTWLEGKIREGSEVVCPRNEVRTPVDVITLSECIMELAGSSFRGIIHIGSTDSIDRVTLIKKLAKALGYNDDLIRPQTDDKISRRVPRHKNGIICVDKAGNILKTPLLSVDEGINRIFEERFM